MTTGLVLLAAIAAVVWFWIDSLGAREAAIAAGQRACAQINVQFLDQSVAVRRLGVGRDPRGRLLLRRVFVFEFSSDGGDRRRGRVVTLGRRVEAVNLDQDRHTVWMDQSED
jgi:hypothetical protein